MAFVLRSGLTDPRGLAAGDDGTQLGGLLLCRMGNGGTEAVVAPCADEGLEHHSPCHEVVGRDQIGAHPRQRLTCGSLGVGRRELHALRSDVAHRVNDQISLSGPASIDRAGGETGATGYVGDRGRPRTRALRTRRRPRPAGAPWHRAPGRSSRRLIQGPLRGSNLIITVIVEYAVTCAIIVLVAAVETQRLSEPTPPSVPDGRSESGDESAQVARPDGAEHPASHDRTDRSAHPPGEPQRLAPLEVRVNRSVGCGARREPELADT